MFKNIFLNILLDSSVSRRSQAMRLIVEVFDHPVIEKLEGFEGPPLQVCVN
jgi:hypothetical protein